MKTFIIITGFNKKQKVYEVVILVHDVTGALIPQQIFIVDEQTVLSYVNSGAVPLNFGIKNGRIAEDWGAFSRFDNMPCFIVLCEIITQAGRKLGYRIYDIHSKTVSNVKMEQIKEHIKANTGVVLFQNAIIKNDTVCAYPNKEFLKMVVGTAVLKKQKIKTAEPKNPPSAASAQLEFTPKQLEVIKKAKENGIKGSWLTNPAISAKQMNLLCRAKARGALAEYFADPRMEPDHIDFWADRLYDKKLAQDCKPLLKRPDIALEPLTDLFDCAIDGTKYDDLLDKSPKQIRKEHYERSDKFWYKSSMVKESESDLHLKMYAKQLKDDCDTLKTEGKVVKR